MRAISERTGMAMLHGVAGRVIARYLDDRGRRDVALRSATGSDGVDLTYGHLGRTVGVKIKADPYIGVDGMKCSDRSLPFYRPDGRDYALESVAHDVERKPGWAQVSSADELFYYLLAIDQTEEEVAELLDAPDEVFFPGIRVMRDDLHIIPMGALNRWFSAVQSDYPSRPVTIGDQSSWHRIVPMDELDSAVPGVTRVGSIYRS